MKVLLVYPPTVSGCFFGLPRTPPLGICYLASVLLEKGHKVKLIDMRLKNYGYEKLERLIKKFKPKVAGVSATSFDYPGAQQVLQFVKKISPKTITVLGGMHASLVGNELIKSLEVDVIVKGEGEKSFPKLINCLEKERSLSYCEGVIYKNKNGEIIDKRNQAKIIFDLDKIPFPRFDLLPLEEYRAAGFLELPIITSRGCPYNCIFCASWHVHGRTYRGRSGKNVVDEIEQNIKKYRTKNFTVVDDNFNFDKKRVKEICKEIIRRKLDISWQCAQGIRADRADEEVFQLMKKAGCRLVALGIESTSPKVLKAIRKGETIGTIKKALKAAKRAGLIVKAFFIVGAPKDNEETVKKSVEFFQKSPDIDIPRISNMVVYPYTDLWDWVEKKGRFLNNPLDYITKNAEQSFGTQFETRDFPKEKRLKMFNWSSAEAEKKIIKYRLNSMFGEKIGKYFYEILKTDIFRKILKEMYRFKLIKLAD